MKKEFKKQLLRAALTAGGDLGGKTVTRLLGVLENDDVPAEDPISNAIFNAVYNAEDRDDVDNNFEYAIHQLQKAREACKK